MDAMEDRRLPGQVSGRKPLGEMRPPPKGPAGVVVHREPANGPRPAHERRQPERQASDNPHGSHPGAAGKAAVETLATIPLLSQVVQTLLRRGEFDTAAIARQLGQQRAALGALWQVANTVGGSPTDIREAAKRCYKLATDCYRLNVEMLTPLLTVRSGAVVTADEPSDASKPAAAGATTRGEPTQVPSSRGGNVHKLDPRTEAGRSVVASARQAIAEGKAGDAVVTVSDPEVLVAIVDPDRVQVSEMAEEWPGTVAAP